jgi:hypothetical protein
MPKRLNSHLLTGEITRTEDCVGVAAEQGSKEFPVFGGIVLKVGILNDAEIAASLPNGGADSGTLPLISLVMKQSYPGFRSGQALQNFRRTIGGPVIHNNYFPLHIFRKRRGEHLSQTSLDDSAFVVNGY